MTRFRTVAVSIGAGAVLALSACGNGPPAASSSSGGGGGGDVGKGGAALGTATVMVASNDQDQFAPAASTAKVGDIIEWTNAGSHTHNVTFDEYQPLSGSLDKGEKWQVSFTKAGSYEYHCTFHPNMTAKLTVS